MPLESIFLLAPRSGGGRKRACAQPQARMCAAASAHACGHVLPAGLAGAGRCRQARLSPPSLPASPFSEKH